MRDSGDGSSVRVIPAGPGPGIVQPRPRRSGLRLVLLLGMVVAGGVFAISSPVERSVSPEDLDVASLTGELDLTRADAVDTWTQSRIDEDPMILDVTEIDGRIVALGGQGGRAAAWMTTEGESWEPVSLQAIESTRSIISHAVEWSGQTYAFGRQGSEPTLWRAVSPDRWIQETTIPPFLSAFLVDVVAGNQGLLAVTARPDGEIAAFWSEDAFTWAKLDANGLNEAEQAQAFAAHNDWFYAVGADCTGGACRPVIHRSLTGDEWLPVALSFTGVGRLLDVAASDRGLVVAGVAEDNGLAAPILLRSADGMNWERVEGSVFEPPNSVVELLGTDTAADGATVVIDGRPYQLGVGASVRNEATLFTVANIGEGRLTLEFPDGVRTLQIGDRLTARGGLALQRVVAQGDRLVVAGAYLTDGAIPRATAAGVWSSTDGGERWTQSTWNASSFGATVVPFTPSARMLLIRGARGEVNTWVSEWESSAAEGSQPGLGG